MCVGTLWKQGGAHCVVENVHGQMISEDNVCMNIFVSVSKTYNDKEKLQVYK